jgi:hypothetical protein
MDPATVLETWRAAIDLDTRLRTCGRSRLDAAQERFIHLSAIQDEDELRSRLASGDQKTDEVPPAEVREDLRTKNNDLALWILSEAARRPVDAESAKESLSWIEWMLLVSQFGKEHHLFKAHGKALQGMLFMADEQPTEAQQAFEESAGDYRDLAGLPLLPGDHCGRRRRFR